MKNALKKVRVRYPVKRPDVKREAKKPSEESGKIRMFAASVAEELCGYSPLEKKVISLIEAKNNSKAQRILRKRLGSHKRAGKRMKKLTKMLLEE
ncbi:60S ribosomal protein L36 [Encephalitozoon intestinalis ATCC 50506]|uniref:60S ribosomal protein L36 n=1 Tax=Encephalitozoon intestinalis (strain ATCC 50506) TaxID=876142 RepID=E0S7N3_ENCIT|nr:60S ribosomal protein L36 [Encephalitozoon intestinalis ATCC 50506]ADM11712.1 60S ribosomal protein L36 [Encephalitozoon intestinalis ATCC 50506]UTX45449.1 ribosomal protein L36 [Encephalitozoon intestinalis]